MKYTAEEAYAAVARGASWLDQKCPEWTDMIDLEKLSLRSPHMCILGQTAKCLIPEDAPIEFTHWSGYGDVVLYYRAVKHDFLVTDASYYGFDIRPPDELYDPKEETAAYEMLDIAWQELIRARREQVLTQ